MKASRLFAPSFLAPALAVILFLSLPGGASAYTLPSPPRTWDCPPDFVVDNRAGGLASVVDGDGGGSRIVGALLSGVGWRSAGAGKVLSAHSGSVASFIPGDGIPMINLTDPLGVCGASCLAASLSSYSERFPGSGSYRITDHDIVTNVAQPWTSEGEDPGGMGCSGELYVESVMVHETGHALGLAHSAVVGATMSALVSACSLGPASIAADDSAGLVALYGTAPLSTLWTYTNYIGTTGTTQYQPCGSAFASKTGTLQGRLRSPAANFDLFLWKLISGSWVLVASGTNANSTEDVTYAGTAGTYRWGVYSSSGVGQYHFYSSHP